MVTESNFEKKESREERIIKELWFYTQWSNTYELKGNRRLYFQVHEWDFPNKTENLLNLWKMLQ